MSTTITISFSGAAQFLSRPDAQQRILQAIVDATNLQHQYTIAHIQEERLSASKDNPPLPPSMGILRTITGRLRGSVRASKAVIEGSGVSSAIGSNVKYAAIHEYGGTMQRRVAPGSVRLRATASGELVRGSTGGAVFAKRRMKRVRVVPFEGGRSFSIGIPARAPFRRGIEDVLPDYERGIRRAVQTTIEAG